MTFTPLNHTRSESSNHNTMKAARRQTVVSTQHRLLRNHTFNNDSNIVEVEQRPLARLQALSRQLDRTCSLPITLTYSSIMPASLLRLGRSTTMNSKQRPTMHSTSIIVAGFAGIGKSWLKNESLLSQKWTVTDQDSADVVCKEGNWETNYVADAISKAQRPYQIILISTHDKVREQLVAQQARFVLVYPDESLLQEYIDRWTARGSDPRFIKHMKENWPEYVRGCEEQTNCWRKIKLQSKQFLVTVSGQILPS